MKWPKENRLFIPTFEMNAAHRNDSYSVISKGPAHGELISYYVSEMKRPAESHLVSMWSEVKQYLCNQSASVIWMEQHLWNAHLECHLKRSGSQGVALLQCLLKLSGPQGADQLICLLLQYVYNFAARMRLISGEWIFQCLAIIYP